MLRQHISPASAPATRPRRGWRAALPWLVLLAATGIAYAPILLHGYPANGWDSRYHAIAGRLFSTQLWAGDIYPRWLMNSNSGAGSPHFFFYAPLAFYIAALFHGLGHNGTALAQIGAGAVLLGYISGATCFLWLRSLVPPAAALAGAVLYLASPYHLFVDLLVRADYAEFAAMAFTPLMLLGVERTLAGKRHGAALVAGGLAAVTLCNVVAGLVVCGLPLAYGIGRAWRRPRPAGALLIVLCATALGLVLSAVYLVPALVWRSAAEIPVVPLPDDAFIFGDPPQTALYRFIRLLFLGDTALVAALALWLRRGAGLPPGAGTCLTLAAAALALTTIWARPLWMLIPTSWTIQMSYRLFIIIDPCLACLVALAAVRLTKLVQARSRARFTARHVAAAIAILSLAASLAGAAMAQRAGVFDTDAALWANRSLYAPDYGLFRPNTVHGKLPADVLPLYNGGPLYNAGKFGPPMALPDRIRGLDPAAHATITGWAPRHIQLTVTAAAPGTLVVNQLFFPGWQAHDAGTGAPLDVAPAVGGGGLVAIFYPAGETAIDLRLARLWPEWVGLAVSLAGVAGLAMLVWFQTKKESTSF